MRSLIGALNAFNGQVNVVKNEITGEDGSIPDVARSYKAHGAPWIVVADSNYGEGSAREHAALQPRYLGGKAIICRSFARIHGTFRNPCPASLMTFLKILTLVTSCTETNLKKQGVLPLTFANPADYDRITQGSIISTKGLPSISPGSKISIVVKTPEGQEFEIEAKHTMSADQIEWFKAGSALNMIAASQAN